MTVLFLMLLLWLDDTKKPPSQQAKKKVKALVRNFSKYLHSCSSNLYSSLLVFSSTYISQAAVLWKVCLRQDLIRTCWCNSKRAGRAICWQCTPQITLPEQHPEEGQSQTADTICLKVKGISLRQWRLHWFVYISRALFLFRQMEKQAHTLSFMLWWGWNFTWSRKDEFPTASIKLVLDVRMASAAAVSLKKRKPL